jgi:hypothetical protein
MPGPGLSYEEKQKRKKRKALEYGQSINEAANQPVNPYSDTNNWSDDAWGKLLNNPELAQGIRDGMMKNAMQNNNTPNKQSNSIGAGRVSAGGGPQLTQQEDPWNFQGTRAQTPNNGLFGDMTNLEMATLFDNEGLLSPIVGTSLPRPGDRDGNLNRLDRFNSFKLDNYNGESFSNTDDIFTYIDSLDLNLNRRTFKGGRGGVATTSDTAGQNTLKSSTHDFVNLEYARLGKPVMYQEGDAVYVLYTGHGSNEPVLDASVTGNNSRGEDGAKFSGHGGYYHSVGDPPKPGEYQKFVPQNKQGPDTDMLSDQIMPVVIQIAMSTILAGALAPVGAAIAGAGTAGTATTGLLTSAASTTLNQLASGEGLDLSDIAVSGLKGGITAGVMSEVSAFSENYGGGFQTGAIDGAAQATITGLLEGEFDLEDIITAAGTGGFVSSVRDGFNDLFQTDDIADLARQELGKPEWNYLDMTDAQIAGMSPEALTEYATQETAFGEHIAKLHQTTDFGKLFGEEGLLNDLGFDTEYLSTAPLVDVLEFLATPFNGISEFLGGDALYAPSAAGNEWDEAFRQEWGEKKSHLYGEAFADTYYSAEDERLYPGINQALEDHKMGALESAMGLEEYLGYNSRTGEYENSNYDIVGMAQSQASNQDLDFFRDVNYTDPNMSDGSSSTVSQQWVDGVLSDLDAGIITEGEALFSLNNAADYNFQQNVRYDERFTAFAPRDDNIPWTHIQETDPMAGRFNTPDGNRPGGVDYLKNRVAGIPQEAKNFIGDVEGMLQSGASSWSDAINIVTDAYDAWESGESALSEGTDFESYMEQNLQASTTPNELYANLGIDTELVNGDINPEDTLPNGNINPEDTLPNGNINPEEVVPPPSEPPRPDNPDYGVSEEVLPPPPGKKGGGEDSLPKGPTNIQQKAEQDNYMIDKELYRLARITQVISLSEGDLASVKKRMAVLREQKEAIAGDIVGAVQKKSGKYIKQTYEEEGRRKRTREDNIVKNPEILTTETDV